jgi:hypothetical protein
LLYDRDRHWIGGLVEVLKDSWVDGMDACR